MIRLDYVQGRVCGDKTWDLRLLWDQSSKLRYQPCVCHLVNAENLELVLLPCVYISANLVGVTVGLTFHRNRP